MRAFKTDPVTSLRPKGEQLPLISEKFAAQCLNHRLLRLSKSIISPPKPDLGIAWPNQLSSDSRMPIFPIKIKQMR
jgi:hypothetical protein